MKMENWPMSQSSTEIREQWLYFSKNDLEPRGTKVLGIKDQEQNMTILVIQRL